MVVVAGLMEKEREVLSIVEELGDMPSKSSPRGDDDGNEIGVNKTIPRAAESCHGTALFWNRISGDILLAAFPII